MNSFSSFYPWLRLDSLNSFVVLAIGLFFVLTVIYSARFMEGRPSLIQYYTYIILTAIASVIAVLANNLILLLVCWGFLGLTLYLLIGTGSDASSAAAKKAFIIVGGSDALMLLGIGIIYYLTKEFQMDKIRLELNSGLTWLAYLSIAVGCFAKAGAMPFHSWIPDCAQAAPAPVVAFLPASLDKLLGIYLLARVSLELFSMNQAMSLFLMMIGAFTIVAAAMMALIQHNMKRLLAYSTVSQVGYMVLGLSTGLPIGIAGGIFHMLNHTIYKSCLFLTAGNVEYSTKTTELNELGGLARFMPLTYVSTLIAGLSLSGIPPFNGFFSKWMIYQGLIERLSFGGRPLVIICLAAAMFGSGLTLAGFMKLLHAVFLGQPSQKYRKPVTEVSWAMWLPCVLLALICVIFGVFANQIPMKYFILPAVGGVGFIGNWYAGLSTLLIMAGFLLGLFILSLKGLRPVIREDQPYVGGEVFPLEEVRVTGTEFYNTFKELKTLRFIYKRAEAGAFDIYEQGKTAVFGIGRFLQFLHNGVLPTYLVWTLLGMIALFFVLVR
ncbi:MAG: proton-conducting transporter membrane subunit [Candidatus Omnitrophota bacterium]